MTQITRLVQMTFKHEAIQDFLQVFQDSKNLIRAFPGNLHVELLQDVQKPNIFFTYSIWQNQEALENYRQSELFKQTWAKTKILFLEKAKANSTKRISKGELNQ